MRSWRCDSLLRQEEDQHRLPVLGGEQGPEKTTHTRIFTLLLKKCEVRTVKSQASQVEMEATTKGKAFLFSVFSFFSVDHWDCDRSTQFYMLSNEI